MPRRRSTSRLESQLKSARARARRLADSDPVQQLGMGAVGGALIALMNQNNLKLPIPGVPASLQVGATALIVQKVIKPKGMLKKALSATVGASGAIFGYGMAAKFGPGGNRDSVLLGADEFAVLGEHQESFDYLGTGSPEHVTEG